MHTDATTLVLCGAKKRSRRVTKSRVGPLLDSILQLPLSTDNFNEETYRVYGSKEEPYLLRSIYFCDEMFRDL